mgnify:CR=1 FL=1
MTGSVKTPAEIKRAVTLRNAGHSLSSISLKTQISASTLIRHFNKLKVTKGIITSDAVEAARQELLSDVGFIGDLKIQIASSISDDLSQAIAIRESIALSLEQLTNDDTELASVKARSLSALSTAIKITQEVQRKALNVEEYTKSLDLEELPELKIVRMSEDQETEIANIASKGMLV